MGFAYLLPSSTGALQRTISKSYFIRNLNIFVNKKNLLRNIKYYINLFYIPVNYLPLLTSSYYFFYNYYHLLITNIKYSIVVQRSHSFGQICF